MLGNSALFFNSGRWSLCGRECLVLWMFPFVGIDLTCTTCMFNFLGSMRLCFELNCVFVIFFRAERQQAVLGVTPVVSAMHFHLGEPRKCLILITQDVFHVSFVCQHNHLMVPFCSPFFFLTGRKTTVFWS